MSIHLRSSWKATTASREAWAAWLECAKKHDPWLREFWEDLSGCEDCVHICEKDHWCELLNYPANVNPYLEDLGMACMGAGKQVPNPEGQLLFEFMKIKLPF